MILSLDGAARSKFRRQKRRARKQAPSLGPNISLLSTGGKEEEGLVGSLWHLMVAHTPEVT